MYRIRPHDQVFWSQVRDEINQDNFQELMTIMQRYYMGNDSYEYLNSLQEYLLIHYPERVNSSGYAITTFVHHNLTTMQEVIDILIELEGATPASPPKEHKIRFREFF